MNKILIQAWNIYRLNDEFYIEYTHYIYLQEISKMYCEIYLISPVIDIDESEVGQRKKISTINASIVVKMLPGVVNYISAVKNFFYYLREYNSLKKINFDLVYTRFPSPFGWLQKYFFRSKRVVHFVGDPIDTVLVNKKMSALNKFFKIILFLPEYFLFLMACYGNVKVFSNGHHIAYSLKKYGISAKPLISSTLLDSDYFIKDTLNSSNVINLVYVGYLRKAKGVDVLINALNILKNNIDRKFVLTIVGTGEEENRLKKIVEENKLDVFFAGHVDDRIELNAILRNSDIFCFASLSEGSPRVVLEAMANNLPVISTPVGSLPHVFQDNVDILFFNFDDHIMLAEKINILSEDKVLRSYISNNSFEKVQKFKLTNFIQEVFNA